MKRIKILCFALMIIRQVSGEQGLRLVFEDEEEQGLRIIVDEEADKKCDQWDYYKCGDVCTWHHFSCSCGNVTLTKHSPYYCCTQPGDKCSRLYYRI